MADTKKNRTGKAEKAKTPTRRVVVEEVVIPETPKTIDRAIACYICEKEYTHRRMGEGNPYAGKPVCTGCLPKAVAEEKAIKDAAEDARIDNLIAETQASAMKTAIKASEENGSED